MRKLAKDGKIVSRANPGTVVCVNPDCPRVGVPTPRDNAAAVNITTAGLQSNFQFVDFLIS